MLLLAITRAPQCPIFHFRCADCNRDLHAGVVGHDVVLGRVGIVALADVIVVAAVGDRRVDAVEVLDDLEREAHGVVLGDTLADDVHTANGEVGLTQPMWQWRSQTPGL